MLAKLFLALAIATGGSVGVAATVEMQFRETRVGEWDVLAEVIPEEEKAIGLAAFSFNIVDTDPSAVSFSLGPLGGMDATTGEPIGFTNFVAGTVGDFYSVGANQATSSGQSEVFGIGIDPIDLPSASGQNLRTEVPALLGTLTTPQGLGEANFRDVHLDLFLDGYDGLRNGVTQPLVLRIPSFPGSLNVTVTPIPEPSTLAITTLTLAGVVVHRRRKNKAPINRKRCRLNW